MNPHRLMRPQGDGTSISVDGEGRDSINPNKYIFYKI